MGRSADAHAGRRRRCSGCTSTRAGPRNPSAELLRRLFPYEPQKVATGILAVRCRRSVQIRRAPTQVIILPTRLNGVVRPPCQYLTPMSISSPTSPGNQRMIMACLDKRDQGTFRRRSGRSYPPHQPLAALSECRTVPGSSDRGRCAGTHGSRDIRSLTPRITTD